MNEIAAESATSHMHVYCDEIAQQSEQTRMNISGRNTILASSISRDPLPQSSLDGATVDLVTTFKLGVRVSSRSTIDRRHCFDC